MCVKKVTIVYIMETLTRAREAPTIGTSRTEYFATFRGIFLQLFVENDCKGMFFF